MMETRHLAAAAVMADQCLCYRARGIARAVTRLYDAALRPMGIQATQLTLMNVIARVAARVGGGEGTGRGGGAPMSQIAAAMAMDVTTVSRTVRTLEAGGLVAIERSPEDRRVRLVRLTEAGERKVAEALPAWRSAHARVVEALGPELAAVLRDGFDAAVEAAVESAEHGGEEDG
ncbi:MAG: MarR family winged helix-turn-helix transcriptional regulator [Gemmatimonadota bacterium]